MVIKKLSEKLKNGDISLLEIGQFLYELYQRIEKLENDKIEIPAEIKRFFQ
jgi:uncharacterized protein (UPF0335 family)